MQLLYQSLRCEVYYSSTRSVLPTACFIWHGQALVHKRRTLNVWETIKIGMVGEVMGNGVKRDRCRAHFQLFSSHNGGIICAVVKLCLSYS